MKYFLGIDVGSSKMHDLGCGGAGRRLRRIRDHAMGRLGTWLTGGVCGRADRNGKGIGCWVGYEALRNNE